MTTEHQTCDSIRELIPLLASHALDADEQALVELHLNACTPCQEKFQAQKQALDTVQNVTEVEAASEINSAKILTSLKQRMAIESREHIVPATAAISSHGSKIWLGVLVAGVVAALAVVAILGRPENHLITPPPSHPIAIFFQRTGSTEDSGTDLFVKNVLEANDLGGRIVFPNNAEVRLKPGTIVSFEAPQTLRLTSGQLAIWIPVQEALTIHGPRATVRPLGDEGARFTFEVEPGNPASELLQVAHGAVRWKGSTGGPVSIHSAKASRLSSAGQAVLPWAINARQAFAWVTEQTIKRLQCEFSFEPKPTKASHRPWLGVVSIRNTGDRAVNISTYYPLGVNYQLELRRRNATSSEFQKLSPTAIHRRIAPDQTETLQPAKGFVVLDPGHSYELEIDLNQVIGSGTIEWCAAHYIGYEQTSSLQGSGSIHSVWGFTLHSENVKF